MMPPSPSLSARVMIVTYLTVTTSTSAQNTSDRMPSTVSWSAASPNAGSKAIFRVYSGLVPMSPNTTPIAATTRPASPGRPDAGALPPRARAERGSGMAVLRGRIGPCAQRSADCSALRMIVAASSPAAVAPRAILTASAGL